MKIRLCANWKLTWIRVHLCTLWFFRGLFSWPSRFSTCSLCCRWNFLLMWSSTNNTVEQNGTFRRAHNRSLGWSGEPIYTSRLSDFEPTACTYLSMQFILAYCVLDWNGLSHDVDLARVGALVLRPQVCDLQAEVVGQSDALVLANHQLFGCQHPLSSFPHEDKSGEWRRAQSLDIASHENFLSRKFSSSCPFNKCPRLWLPAKFCKESTNFGMEPTRTGFPVILSHVLLTPMHQPHWTRAIELIGHDLRSLWRNH